MHLPIGGTPSSFTRRPSFPRLALPSPDTLNLLQHVLEEAGMSVVAGLTSDVRAGRLDPEAFIAEHRPHVIVFDLVPPYEPNWRFLQRHPAMRLLGRKQLVITSTNAQSVRNLVGGDERVYAVLEKPYDVDYLVSVVREAGLARRQQH